MVRDDVAVFRRELEKKLLALIAVELPADDGVALTCLGMSLLS